jgi:hypothetical protein
MDDPDGRIKIKKVKKYRIAVFNQVKISRNAS